MIFFEKVCLYQMYCSFITSLLKYKRQFCVKLIFCHHFRDKCVCTKTKFKQITIHFTKADMSLFLAFWFITPSEWLLKLYSGT